MESVPQITVACPFVRDPHDNVVILVIIYQTTRHHNPKDNCTGNSSSYFSPSNVILSHFKKMESVPQITVACPFVRDPHDNVVICAVMFPVLCVYKKNKKL